MQVKNISARGWYVGDKLVAPLETVELSDDFYNDVKDNADLEVLKEKSTKGKKADKEELSPPVIESDKDAE